MIFTKWMINTRFRRHRSIRRFRRNIFGRRSSKATDRQTPKPKELERARAQSANPIDPIGLSSTRDGSRFDLDAVSYGRKCRPKIRNACALSRFPRNGKSKHKHRPLYYVKYDAFPAERLTWRRRRAAGNVSYARERACTDVVSIIAFRVDLITVDTTRSPTVYGYFRFVNIIICFACCNSSFPGRCCVIPQTTATSFR